MQVYLPDLSLQPSTNDMFEVRNILGIVSVNIVGTYDIIILVPGITGIDKCGAYSASGFQPKAIAMTSSGFDANNSSTPYRLWKKYLGILFREYNSNS
jgi:hypothetical protein